MAKVKGATITFEVTDDGSLRMLDQQAKKTSKSVGKVGKSAGDTRRNMQAMSGRVESGTKGFARMQQGTGGLVQSYAILASTLFAVGAAFRALQNAANVENQIKGFRALGEITGESMMGVTAAVRAATGGLLNFQDAAQQSAIGMAAGFSQEQLAGLAEGAKIASVTLGRDLTDSFNRLIRGVTKAEPELLDELGIILRLDIATRKFANANGLIAEKLTIAQRRAAVFEEVQRQLIANFGAMEDEADNLLNPFDRLMTKINDFVISIQGPIVSVFGGIADFLSNNFAALVTAVSMFALSILKQIVPSFQAMGASAVTAGNVAAKKMRALNIHIIRQKKSIKAVEAQFGASEVKKNQFFVKALKKRGISEKAFAAMSIREQKRITRSFILEEQKKEALGKKFNKQRLAAFLAVEKRIQLESKKTTLTIGAHTKIAGAHIQAGLARPLLMVQAGIARVGVMAAGLAPVFAFLGTVVNLAFGVIMAFFTAKFIVDMLPFTKRLNASISAIKEDGKVLSETVKDLSHTMAGDLSDKRITQIKEEFEGLEGAVLAANYEIERLDNILKRGQSGKKFIKELEESLTENFGQGQSGSTIAQLLGGSKNSAGQTGFVSKAYKAQVRNVVVQLQAMAMKEMEAVRSSGRTDINKFMGFDALFAQAGMSGESAAFKKQFEEIMNIEDISTRKSELAGLMADSATAMSDSYKSGIGFLRITEKGNVLITAQTRALLENGDVGIEAFQKITGVIPGTQAAAEELKETLQNMMPKPSQAEAAMSGLRTLMNEFSTRTVGEDGKTIFNLKEFSIVEEGMESIVQKVNAALGLSFQVTENHKEDARNLLEILHLEEQRLDIADQLIDTATAFNSALKTQENMVKFLNTSASKRFQIDLKILRLQQKIVQLNSKDMLKSTKDLINMEGELAENRARGVINLEAATREIQSQIDLLIAMKDPIEQIGKTLLESFDKSAISELTKLIDTMDLSEFGGDEMINGIAKSMKTALAGQMAESIIRPITDQLTPDAFKLNKKLNPAEQMLLAHKKHVTGLADVLNQHVAAMGATMGVKAPDISSGGTLTNAKGSDLYSTGGDTLPGGFKEKFKEMAGGIKNFIFGKEGATYSGFDHTATLGTSGVTGTSVFPEGLTDEQKATLIGGGEVNTSIPNIFERFFGEEGMFSKVGSKLFGEDGMFSKVGSSLFGEDGLLSGLFSGGGGLLEGLKGAFSGIFGAISGAGGGILSAIGGMFGMPTGLAKGGIIGDIQAMAKGGITGYNRGGIATQPTYLVGEGKNNEAVVPLPDNKSIPVNLGGATGSTNNTNISVNVSDGGTTTKMEADGAKEMASAINMAVLAEIEKQQRPGGLLGA